MTSSQLAQRYKFFTALLLSTSILNLIAAYSAEYFFYIRPCVLCIYTRYIYIALIAASFLAYRTSRTQRMFRHLVGTLLLLGTLFAIYHIGVENRWWAGTAACYNTLDFSSLRALKATLSTSPYSSCDVVQWRLLGISITLWNALWFGAFLIGHIALTHKIYQSNQRP